jgi:hypothetical protein
MSFQGGGGAAGFCDEPQARSNNTDNKAKHFIAFLLPQEGYSVSR